MATVELEAGARWSLGPEAGVSIYGVDVSYMGRRQTGETQHGLQVSREAHRRTRRGLRACELRDDRPGARDAMEVDIGLQLKAPFWIKRPRRGAPAVAAR